MQEGPLDERSLELVHLLQIAPRIPYAAAGKILAVTPSTLAARWRRLTAAGAAWITAYPSPRVCGLIVAYVEIATQNSERDAVVTRLVQRPEVVSVEVVARHRQIMATVFAADLPHLRAFTLDELGSWPQVGEVATSVATRSFVDASTWRLDALDGPQRAAAAAHATTPPGARVPTVGAARALLAEDADLVHALIHNPRASVADLARACGAHPATVRRHLDRLLRSGGLVLRCDMDHAAFGWPYSASWFARIDPRSLPRVAAELARLPQVRLVAGLQGRSNLVISVFSRTLEGLSRWEQQLAVDFPELALGESVLHMRFHKRMGRLIDASGRPTGQLTPPLLPPRQPGSGS